MPDQPPVELHPAALQVGDRIVVDPDDPARPVDWEITKPAYLEPIDGVPVVDYVTGDGTEGTHAFLPPVSSVHARRAPQPKPATHVSPARVVA